MKKKFLSLLGKSVISSILMLTMITNAEARKSGSQPQMNFDKWGSGWDVKQVAMPGYNVHKWISAHVKYTKDAKTNKIDGKIMLKVLVDNQGKVMDAQVMGDKLGYGLDESAIAAIKNMPKFKKPAIGDNGKAVASYYRIPITYSLTDNSTK